VDDLDAVVAVSDRAVAEFFDAFDAQAVLLPAIVAGVGGGACPAAQHAPAGWTGKRNEIAHR